MWIQLFVTIITIFSVKGLSLKKEVAVTLLAFTVLLEKVIASISFKQFLLIW